MPKTSLQRAIDAKLLEQPRSTATFAKVTFSVIPPSANKLFVVVPLRRGQNWDTRRVRTREYVAWYKLVFAEVKLQRVPMVDGNVELHWQFERPAGGSDLDNRIKAASDLLVAAGVISDDRHVVALSARWSDEVHGVEVEVRKV